MRLFLFYTLVIFLFGCDRNPHPGYSSSNQEGLYYKVLSFQENQDAPKQGDVLEFRMARVEYDSLVWQDSKLQALRIDTLGQGLRALLIRFHVGDSVSVLMYPEAYNQEFKEFPLPEDRISDMRLNIKGRIPEAKWLRLLELDRMSHSDREQGILADYFKNRADSSLFTFDNGIWVNELTPGMGGSYLPGEELLVMYKATLLDGVVIDDRNSPEKALSYSLGMQEQLIPGLVTAIKYMERGQELELILPSNMAFGEKGSAGGIVPPWTSVRYVLRVMPRNLEAL
jgi:hypothetical protein